MYSFSQSFSYRSFFPLGRQRVGRQVGLDTNNLKLKLCLTCLGSNPPRQQGFRRTDLSPCSALQTVTFMNKLVIIISPFFCYLCSLITLIHLRPVSPSCRVAEIVPEVTRVDSM